MSRRQRTIKKIIVFNQPSDLRTGFLSNESKHSFTLVGKRWPTVEHYIQAKKFNGTEYEEVIRTAPTVYQARRLSQPKTKFSIDDSGRISRKKVYGRNRRVEYYMREDWKTAEPVLMEEAIRAKFSQNFRLKKRLLDTHNATLQNPQNPILGLILKRIREELSGNPKSPVREETSSDSSGWSSKELKDFEFDHLSIKDRQFVEGMITLSLFIAEEEGWSKVYAGMIEDAAFNLTPDKKTGEAVVKYIKGINSISWTDIYRDMPNYEQVINEIYEMFVKSDPWQTHQIAPSALIAATVRWLHMKATPEQRDVFYKCAARETSEIDIILPKKKRWYRSSPENPPGRSKTKIVPKTRKSKKTRIIPSQTPLTLKEKREVWSIIDEHWNKLNVLTMSQFHSILKERFGRNSVMKKRELKEYVISVLKNLQQSTQEILLSELRTGKIMEVYSSLERFEYSDYIAVIANSTSQKFPSSPTPSEKITIDVFKAYEYADIYTMNRNRVGNPGSIVVTRPVNYSTRVVMPSTTYHRYVICLIAEFNKDRSKKILDTIENRQRWFRHSLIEMFKISLEMKSVAFSSVQLTPRGYRKILEEVSKSSNYSGIVYIITKIPSPKIHLAIPLGGKKAEMPPPENLQKKTKLSEPQNLNIAVRYLKLLCPLKLPNQKYSQTVKQLNSLPNDEREILLEKWEDLSVPQRKETVELYLLKKH